MSEGVRDLGKRIAWLRRLSGLSVAQLAARANMDIGGDPVLKENAIRNLESGRRKDIDLGELAGVAKALDMPPAFILADFLDPFGRSEIEPFHRMNASNADVLDSFAPATGPWKGLTREASHLITDGFTVVAALRDLSGLQSASEAMMDELLTMKRYINPRNMFRRGLVNPVWEGQEETIDLLFAVRVEKLRERRRLALNTIREIRRMHGIRRDFMSSPAAEPIKNTLSWADEYGLPQDMAAVHRHLNKIVGIPGYWEDLNLDVPHAPAALRNSLIALLNNLDPDLDHVKMIRAELQTYLAISCILAETDDRPEIIHSINIPELNRPFVGVIYLYNLKPLGIRQSLTPFS